MYLCIIMSNQSRHDSTTDNDATYDHIVKYIGLFGGVQGLNMLISIVRNKITAYLLGPSGIGLINIYNKVVGLIGQSTNLGISFSAVKHVAELSESADNQRRDELIDTVRMWCMMTAALGMLVGLALSPAISWWTFKNYEYTQTFCSLSLIVAMTAITGGEVAILKGLKQLKKVALISVFAALATLAICIPFYYSMGVNGIVAALVISNAAILAIHLYYSSKVAPWRKTITTLKSIQAGIPMAKLGIAYVLAGLFGQGSDYIIISFIQNNANLDYVGLYNTGYFLAINIGSMLFVAVEADFFPRLSSLVNDAKRVNTTINRQIKVCALLISPCLILEVIAMPIIVNLLYTTEFAQASPMATLGIFHLFFKSLTLPLAYLPLAKGDSTTYFISELLYDIFVAIAVPIFFAKYSLLGAGIALSLASIFDLFFIHIYYGVKYKFRFSLRPIRSYILQFILLGVCVYAAFFEHSWTKWLIYICTPCISVCLSYKELGHRNSSAKHLTKKIKSIKSKL